MPKEVFISRLGNVKLYSVSELASMFGLLEDEVTKKLLSGELKAEKIKDSWYLPDDVIKEQGKLINKLAAAGSRASHSKAAKKSAKPVAITAGVVLLLIILYAIFGPKLIKADFCNSEGVSQKVLEHIANSHHMEDIVTRVTGMCSEEGIEGEAQLYLDCSEFIQSPGRSFMKMASIEGPLTVSGSPKSLFCTGTLNIITQIPMEYAVIKDDGYASSFNIRLK